MKLTLLFLLALPVLAVWQQETIEDLQAYVCNTLDHRGWWTPQLEHKCQLLRTAHVIPAKADRPMITDPHPERESESKAAPQKDKTIPSLPKACTNADWCGDPPYAGGTSVIAWPSKVPKIPTEDKLGEWIEQHCIPEESHMELSPECGPPGMVTLGDAPIPANCKAKWIAAKIRCDKGASK